MEPPTGLTPWGEGISSLGLGGWVLPRRGKHRDLLTIFLGQCAPLFLGLIVTSLFFLSGSLSPFLSPLRPRAPSLSQIDYTGCGINPARSFGSSVITHNFKDHWVRGGRLPVEEGGRLWCPW